MKYAAIGAWFFFVFASLAAAQNLPSKIRGYKVYDAKISVTNAAETAGKTDTDVAVKVLDPELTDLTLSGASVEVGAEITPINKSGTVDFITFRDLRVNGIAVEVAEYTDSFDFNEGKTIVLPKPARISINIPNLARAAYKELTDPKKDWAITGTVLVFGKFKKFGFYFKRVVPVKIDLTIKNPLRNADTPVRPVTE